AATALPGLVLAGAWTDTGWPDTMEGAVRSGLNAARALRQGLAVPDGTGLRAKPAASAGPVRGLAAIPPAGRRPGPGGSRRTDPANGSDPVSAPDPVAAPDVVTAPDAVNGPSGTGATA